MVASIDRYLYSFLNFLTPKRGKSSKQLQPSPSLDYRDEIAPTEIKWSPFSASERVHPNGETSVVIGVGGGGTLRARHREIDNIPINYTCPKSAKPSRQRDEAGHDGVLETPRVEKALIRYSRQQERRVAKVDGYLAQELSIASELAFQWHAVRWCHQPG